MPKAAARRAPPWLPTLILATAATVTAACGVATTQATSTGAAADGGTPTARAATPPVFAGTPPVFATTLVPAHSGRPWPVAEFSATTGRLVRWLTRPQGSVSDLVLSVRGGWAYFAEWRTAGLPPAVWRVKLTGGPARLVRAGTADYALSPDGRVAAYVVTVPHGHAKETTEIAVTNLVTGHRRTIVMVTNPVIGSQVGVTNLAWAPDDTHLAAEVQYAAFASDVLVFNARTARTIADGRKAPCPGGCAAKFPAYLRSGALTYLADQLGDGGPNVMTLVRWTGGQPAKRLVAIWQGVASPPIVQGESTTPQGAAIWALEKQGPQYAIWRWPGGKPVRVRTPLPPGYSGLTGTAW